MEIVFFSLFIRGYWFEPWVKFIFFFPFLFIFLLSVPDNALLNQYDSPTAAPFKGFIISFGPFGYLM